MSTLAKPYPSFTSASMAPAAAATRSNLSLSAFVSILAKSLMMARALPETGRISAKDREKVRRIAESL